MKEMLMESLNNMRKTNEVETKTEVKDSLPKHDEVSHGMFSIFLILMLLMFTQVIYNITVGSSGNSYRLDEMAKKKRDFHQFIQEQCDAEKHLLKKRHDEVHCNITHNVQMYSYFPMEKQFDYYQDESSFRRHQKLSMYREMQYMRNRREAECREDIRRREDCLREEFRYKQDMIDMEYMM